MSLVDDTPWRNTAGRSDPRIWKEEVRGLNTWMGGQHRSIETDKASAVPEGRSPKDCGELGPHGLGMSFVLHSLFSFPHPV